MNKRINLILKIILSIVILSYLFSIIPVQKIWSSILSTDILYVLIGIFLATPISYLSALETQYLTKIQGISLSVLDILKIHLATNFYSLFLPGTLLGGAIKWYKFAKYGSKSSAAAVVVFNRFLEVLITVLIGLLFSFIAFHAFEKTGLTVVLAAIFLFMIFLYLMLLNKNALSIIQKIIYKVPLIPKIFGLREKIGKFIEAMQEFRNLSLKNHFEIFGLLILYHGIGILSFYFFAKSLNININIWAIGWIRSAMSLAIILPLSFAGLGVREATLVILLGYYGVLPSDSMALSFLFFLRNILSSLVGGLFELKNVTFLRGEKKDQEKQLKKSNQSYSNS
jgi:glycosyltransferase 2 family protein